MKKFTIIALAVVLSFSFASCSKEAVKTDAKAKTAEKVVDPKVVCKAECDKTAEACVKAANNNKKKIAACDAAKTKCYADCDKKK